MYGAPFSSATEQNGNVSNKERNTNPGALLLHVDVLSGHLEVPQAALSLEQMPSAGAAAACYGRAMFSTTDSFSVKNSSSSLTRNSQVLKGDGKRSNVTSPFPILTITPGA